MKTTTLKNEVLMLKGNNCLWLSTSRKPCGLARPSAGCLRLSVFNRLLAVACLLVAASAAMTQPARVDDAKLVETGRPTQPHASSLTVPAEIRIVSYNIRWRGGEDLQEIIRLLRHDTELGRASIIGLQEVDRHRQRTQHVNTARVMAEALGMHYAWAAPPQTEDEDEENTGVAILSPYPLTDVQRIVLPHEGPGKRRRAGIGATVKLGAHEVRVYSVHAETRIKMEKKIEQLAATLTDLERYPKIKHAVVLGDFNTIKDKDKDGAYKLFTGAGFSTPFPQERATFKTFIIKLKLDWIWLRGLQATAHGIDREIELSDHWPLWLTAKLDTQPEESKE